MDIKELAKAFAERFAPRRQVNAGTVALEDLRLSSAAEISRDLPRLNARLKRIASQRPRPWRTWRGSQSAELRSRNNQRRTA